MLHAWHDVSPGNDLPRDFQASSRFPSAQCEVRVDKASGLLKVDRIIHSAVFSPANYGFIPQTYADDTIPRCARPMPRNRCSPLLSSKLALSA